MRKPTLSRWFSIIPTAALTVVFAYAAWERFRLPLTPLTDPDLWIYLGPGLNALLGEHFREWFGQCFFYPWFLYVLLRVGSSFRLVTFAQALGGLGTGALLFACWMELRRLLPKSRLPAAIFKLLGAVLAAVYLFSTSTVQFERTLRPEAVFPFVVVLQIYCNLRFIRARFFDGQQNVARLSGWSAIFLSMAAWLLKPSFAGAVLFANLPVIISLFRGGESFRSKLLLVMPPVLAAALLLILPEWKLRRNDPDGPRYVAQSLFSIHADLIDRQMAQDIARHAATPYSPEFLAAAHKALSQVLQESRRQSRHWPALGFYADYLRFGEPGKPAFMRELRDRLGGEDQTAAFCRYYYWRTVWGQPRGMAAKIARQLAVFYNFGDCPAYVTSRSVDLAKAYAQSWDCLERQPQLRRYSPGVALLADTAALTDTRLRIGRYTLTSRINGLLSKTHLLWFLWAIALALCAWANETVRALFGAAAPVLLLLYAYNFGTVLTLAIAHSLDIGRYSQYQFAYTLLPDFAAVWLAIETLLMAVARRNA